MKIDILTGRQRKIVPINMIPAVKIMDTRKPFASNKYRTGTTGMMYMMFPQLPRRASVASVHSGHNTANSDVDMGPKEFQIIPCKKIGRV